MKHWGILTCLAMVFSLFAAPAEVVCHYMQWFDFRLEDGQARRCHWSWGGKPQPHDVDRFDSNRTRDIYSVLYPRIGVYDSTDPAVIDYHILSAKSAGISAFLVDYYPEFNARFGQLLEQSAALGFQAGICYEEKGCWPDWVNNRAGIHSREDAIALAVREFKDLRKYFDHKAYWRKGGKPVVLVFGFVYPRPKGWGEQNGEWRFTASEWRRILQQSGCGDVDLVLQQLRYADDGFNSFLWRHAEALAPRADELTASGKIQFCIGAAGPGFDDRGVGGWGQGARFDPPNLGDEVIKADLARFDASKADTLQIVTWNDYAEGTSIEPTFQYGQLYLEVLGEWSAKRNQHLWQAGRTILPYQYYVLTKQFGADKTQAIKQALNKGDYAAAKELIGELTQAQNYQIAPAIGRDNEFPIYQVSTPAALASKPAVPREKFMLVYVIGAGASNVAAPDARIVTLSADGVWLPGASCGQTFAASLADANPGAVIGVVPLPSASPLSELAPGTRNWDQLVNRGVRAAADGTVAAVWWPGEATQKSQTAAQQLVHEWSAVNAPVLFAKSDTEAFPLYQATLNEKDTAVNLLPELNLAAWRPEHGTARKAAVTALGDSRFEVCPQAGQGKSVTMLYSPMLKFPAGTKLTGSVWAKGEGILRLHAVSDNWKAVPAWDNKPFMSGPIERNGGAWVKYTFTFTAPGEDFPIHFRIDVDAAGAVLLADPKLTR